MFGFRKKNERQPRGVTIVMFLLLGACFLLFGGIVRLYKLRTASVDSQADLAQRLSRGVDQEASELIGLGNKLYKVFLSGGALLEHIPEINRMSQIIQSHKNLEQYIPATYKGLYNLGIAWLGQKDELMKLLGQERTMTYLIVLMNTSEARPNGGFFGSYAIVQFYKGKLMSYKVFDSYYAYHQNSGVNLGLEPNYAKVLDQQSINFISPNVYGFTDIDAGNIKILYEKLFPAQQLDGIIMLKSDLFEQLIPGMRQKLIEWQFTNASVDLIRGQNLPNKKEQYLADIGGYLEQHQSELTDQLIQNLPLILQGGYIQMYFPQASDTFKQFLRDQGLNLKQDPDSLYVWQINKSFNKIDKFVSKKIALQTRSNELIQESSDGIMKLDPNMNAGEYDIYFFYTLSIPQSYIDQIFALAKEYNIELTQRELHILGLSYNWQNQLIVQLPEWMQFESIEGDLFCRDERTTVSAQGRAIGVHKGQCYKVVNMKYNQIVTFDLLSFGNDVLKVVRMKVRKI